MGADVAGFLRPYGRGGRWTKRTATPQKLYPALAAPVSASTQNVAAWTFTAYTQVVAAVAADFFPAMAYLRIQGIPQASGAAHMFFEVEIATGAAGSEVLHSRFSNVVIAAITNFNANDSLTFGFSVPLGPTLIPSGTRVAFRIRCSVSGSTVGFVVAHLYAGGYESLAPDSDPTYPLDEHLRGANSPGLLATPTGSTLSVPRASFPDYAAWTEVWAAAAADSLVWGLAANLQSGVTNTGRHVQLGIGAAGSEVAYELIGVPVAVAVGAGLYFLRRPLLVLSGERLALRSSGGGAGSLLTQTLYEEL